MLLYLEELILNETWWVKLRKAESVAKTSNKRFANHEAQWQCGAYRMWDVTRSNARFQFRLTGVVYAVMHVGSNSLGRDIK